ncbi:MAG: hypothetical protein H6922_04580 [Pseudomonadaceae bacterium]|nr:hypothetical protein [Pseudomonadaceae bacterium]
MAVRTVVNYETQNDITGVGDSFVVDPSRNLNVLCQLTAGTPVAGAKVQITLDDPEKITAGTAVWVDSPLGAKLASGCESILAPVTGVRLSVTDGTWAMKVRQG